MQAHSNINLLNLQEQNTEQEQWQSYPAGTWAYFSCSQNILVPEGGVVCHGDIPATTCVGLTAVTVTLPCCRADAGITIWLWGLMVPERELGVCVTERTHICRYCHVSRNIIDLISPYFVVGRCWLQYIKGRKWTQSNNHVLYNKLKSKRQLVVVDYYSTRCLSVLCQVNLHCIPEFWWVRNLGPGPVQESMDFQDHHSTESHCSS